MGLNHNTIEKLHFTFMHISVELPPMKTDNETSKVFLFDQSEEKEKGEKEQAESRLSIEVNKTGVLVSSPEPKDHGNSIPMTLQSVRQHFQTSSPLKPLGQLNSNFVWTRELKLFKGPGHMTKMACHAYIW